MIIKRLFFLLLLLSATVSALPSPFANSDTTSPFDLYDTTQKPKRVSNQFSFTEGPAVDKAGNIFFTDQPNNKIWKYSVDGKLSVFMDKAGRSNGMYFDKHGYLLTCADEKNQIWKIDRLGMASVLVSDFRGHQLNGPNDLWIDKKNGIYYTDPYYQRDYWERKKPDSALGGQRLYYFSDTAKYSVVADSDLVQPNGIVGTPDRKFLYVADMGRWKTFRYRIHPDGSLHDRQVFCDEGSDGMTLDNKGNLYLTGNGVMVYNPAGKKIAHIEIPEKWTANVCFGGKKKNILFITASESIYILAMKVKGVE